MPSVNLAPGTQQVVAAQRRRRRLFFLTFLIVLAVGMAWGGLVFYRENLSDQLADEQEQLRTIQTEIARLSGNAERVELFEQRLSAVAGLLDRHVDWEPVFQAIERLLPGTVVLKSLQVDSDQGQLSISGATTDTDQVAQALASLLSDQNQTIFSDGQFSQVGRTVLAEEGEQQVVEYDFQITLSFDESILTN